MRWKEYLVLGWTEEFGALDDPGRLKRKFSVYLAICLCFLVVFAGCAIGYLLFPDYLMAILTTFCVLFASIQLWGLWHAYACRKRELADGEGGRKRTSDIAQSNQYSRSRQGQGVLSLRLLLVLYGIPAWYVGFSLRRLWPREPIQTPDWETMFNAVPGVDISLASYYLVMGIILGGLALFAERRALACVAGLCVTATVALFDFLWAAQTLVLSKADYRAFLAVLNAVLFLAYLYALLVHLGWRPRISEHKEVKPPGV